jgi:hypothetical protein
MSETVFGVALAAMLYAAVRALGDRAPGGSVRARLVWILVVAVLAAGLSTVRIVATPLIPMLGIWVAVALPVPWRWRLALGASLIIAAAAVLLGYAELRAARMRHSQQQTTGRPEADTAGGIFGSGDGTLYFRTAPFAECSRFHPPPGTRPLCEKTAPAARNGPGWYAFAPNAPIRSLSPLGVSHVGAFGLGAIRGQPLDYLATVGRDFARYFFPALGPDTFGWGYGPSRYALDFRDPYFEALNLQTVNRYFTPTGLRLGGATPVLADYQRIVRVHGVLRLILLLLAAAGLTVTAGAERRGLALLVAIVLVELAVPVAIAVYDARYAFPLDGALAAAGAIGGGALLRTLKPALSRVKLGGAC